MFAAAMASIAGFAACTANVHDNTVNAQADLTFKADIGDQDVKPGDSVAVSMNATGVVLVDPNDQPKSGDEDKACFYKIFMDDEDSEPLVVTAQAHVQVTIPQQTEKGKHHLICRLFKHDDTATDVEESININVAASGSVMVNADAGASAP
jgi:hypothetical protein